MIGSLPKLSHKWFWITGKRRGAEFPREYACYVSTCLLGPDALCVSVSARVEFKGPTAKPAVVALHCQSLQALGVATRLDTPVGCSGPVARDVECAGSLQRDLPAC